MDGLEIESPSKCICRKVGEPYVYLWVENEWYCYDPKEEPLGSGAMGTVYLGYRVSNGAKVAIKRVKDQYSNQPAIRERARQEAALAFRHPNLIENIGFCEWDYSNGPLFIVSNYVQGEGIKSFIEKMAPTPNKTEKVVNLMLPILDALSYIHARGVVHRDVKPSNIMVENGDNVRLMDLGIARLNGGNRFSTAGFIGTPQYSAPEQILRGDTNSSGEKYEINDSTDIYAAGITMYELITGKNPYDVRVEEEVLGRQMKMPLPGHSAIPQRLMKVLLKATEKEQSGRYQKMADFKAAVMQAMGPEPSPMERFKNWFKKNIWPF